MAAAVLRNLVRVSIFSNYSIIRHSCPRLFSSNARTSFAVVYEENGDPKKVLKSKEHPLPSKIKDNDVLVKMLMSPINPSDINMIEGTYMIKPPLPAIAGNEGVGEVLETGNNVKKFKPGDWILPLKTASGTWQTHAVYGESEVQKIPNDIPPLVAATIAVNPCTAYRMMKDFVNLEPGDVIIQNGANSGVGQAVIQLASAWGLRTVNIVRARPDIDVLTTDLKSLGATHVVTEEFCRTPDMKALMKDLGKAPKLGFNCVGGKAATELLRNLAPNGYMVTYGGMSKQPVTVPTGVFIFKSLKLVGFWMSQWNIDNFNTPQKTEMLLDLCHLARQSKLLAPISELVPITSFDKAIAEALKGFSKKQILVMDKTLL
ncbi:enoyl-[acyl-carrier-protein] reductase, mitochondrial [Octopus bimaculoides]|uniref:Enoyl-[acyl-carrier-protein] reductase, mitochondrial n=1 Tax=Octopus bimaculoides TaxID=37653 RepID=A0A0L8IG41_OCTBM|nr:enoyl-[acyl-carrier-protein] reductase, mitochondrial [Octopus bimaculoides]|eukprot:XP_014768198.1 PREDICTED: trans-2-enoyl-CoA reductase, mitochondrial-like [Octopus bimaculoides]